MADLAWVAKVFNLVTAPPANSFRVAKLSDHARVAEDFLSNYSYTIEAKPLWYS